MVRASDMPKGGFDEALEIVSDGLFFMETLIGGKAYGFIDGTYSRYRRHAGNVTYHRDKGLMDLARMFRIVRDRYPSYRRDADLGEANLVLYGHGLKCLQEGDAREAVSYFKKSLAMNPRNMKTWFRIVQASLARVGFRTSRGRSQIQR
jgi:hypothetical protein